MFNPLGESCDDGDEMRIKLEQYREAKRQGKPEKLKDQPNRSIKPGKPDSSNAVTGRESSKQSHKKPHLAAIDKGRARRDSIPTTTMAMEKVNLKRAREVDDEIVQPGSRKSIRIENTNEKEQKLSNASGRVQPSTIDRLRQSILYRQCRQDPSFNPLIEPSAELKHLIDATPDQVWHHRKAIMELADRLQTLMIKIDEKMHLLEKYHEQVVIKRRPIIPGTIQLASF